MKKHDNQPPMHFPMQARGIHFIEINPQDMAAAGFDPSRQIVPAWFGLKADLKEVPASCPVKVSGRSQYKLFVNGLEIVFGPLRSTKSVAIYDELDLAPYLTAGENHLLMQVLSYPENPPVRSEAGPCYCYGDNAGPAIAFEGVLGTVDLNQAANWSVYLDPSMKFCDYEVFLQGASELVDGIKKADNPFLKEKWELSGLPGAIEGSAIDIDPFGCRHDKTFLPRPIPLLYRREKIFAGWEPVTIAPDSSYKVVLDAGELTTAYFRIGFAGGRGSVVQMTYSESYYKLDENGKRYKDVRDDASGFIEGVFDEYIPSGAEEIYEPFRFRCFRFIELEVETKDSPLTILPQPYIETAYPLENKKRPVFSSARQEKLYDVALRTLQLCMHDTYEDCPYYEQLMYACDTRLEMLFTYACSGDTRLPARGIDLFAKSMLENGFTQARFPSREPQIIPVFSLYFVLMVEDYINETGDVERMRPYIPLCERIVEIFLNKREEHGMCAPQGYWDYFDWTESWAGQFSVPTAALRGCSALQNVFVVYVLQSLIRLLEKTDRSSLAAYYQTQAEELLALVQKYCYDPVRGLYKEGPNCQEFTQHTQIYAVLTGLAEGDAAKQIMEKVLTEDMIPCSYMQRFYLFRALEKADMYDRTEELWEEYYRLLNLHLTTLPETPFDTRSDCHAWSALPLYEFRVK